MEVTIHVPNGDSRGIRRMRVQAPAPGSLLAEINGQAVSVEVTVEVYEYLDRARRKEENLAHEQRRH